MTYAVSKHVLAEAHKANDAQLSKAVEVFSKARLFVALEIREGNYGSREFFAKWGEKQGHAFLSILLGQMGVEWTSEVPVAAVSFSSKHPRGLLALNPMVIKNLKAWEVAGILVHEVLHVMLEHLAHSTRSRENPRLANIAMDVVVNREVVNLKYRLPSRAGAFDAKPEQEMRPVTLKSFNEMCAELGAPEALPGKNWEYYHDHIKPYLPPPQGGGGGASGGGGGESPEGQEGAGGEGQDSQDPFENEASKTDHTRSGDQDSASGEMNRRLVAEALQAAAAKAEAEGGQVPGQLQGLYKQLVRILTPPVYLEQFLPEILAGCGTETAYVSRTRFNRHGVLARIGFRPGASLGVVIDTSGSVRDQEFGAAIGLLQKYRMETGMTVFVQQCSHGGTVDIYELPADITGENAHARCGYGGTFMKPGIEAFVAQNDEGTEFQVGGILVISDGELSGLHEVIDPSKMEIPLTYLFSRKVDPFPKGAVMAGQVYYYDAKTGEVECLRK